MTYQTFHTYVMWLPTCICLLAAISPSSRTHTLWRISGLSAGFSLLASTLSFASFEGSRIRLDADIPADCMLILICFLAVIITRFSRSYLRGEPEQNRFIRALMATFGFATAVVISPRLDLLVVSWTLSSVALHRLLVHYPERRAAQLAAHKKFLVSRTAELLLLVGVFAVYQTFGTMNIGELNATVAHGGMHSPAITLFALCISLAVILKSAQLPLHGWLIQVMEAPTPVSALLHAGVVNLGGLLLIRLHPFLDLVPTAQVLLTAVGTLTFLLSGTIMMTRVSIKLRLAWSTCAQMGFLLAECGAGLYSLALLHLLGHSLYKSYLFLSSGGTVESYSKAAYLPASATRGSSPLWPHIASVFMLASILLGARILLAPWLDVPEPIALVAVCVGLAPLLAGSFAEPRRLFRASARTVALAALYFTLHALVNSCVPPLSARNPAVPSIFALGLVLLYAVQTLVRTGNAQLGYRLRIWTFHGFYLDELFTRWVLDIWPLKSNTTQSAAPDLGTASEEYA